MEACVFIEEDLHNLVLHEDVVHLDLVVWREEEYISR